MSLFISAASLHRCCPLSAPSTMQHAHHKPTQPYNHLAFGFTAFERAISLYKTFIRLLHVVENVTPPSPSYGISPLLFWRHFPHLEESTNDGRKTNPTAANFTAESCAFLSRLCLTEKETVSIFRARSAHCHFHAAFDCFGRSKVRGFP